MKNYVIGIFAALLVVGGIGVFFMTQDEDTQPSNAPAQTQTQSSETTSRETANSAEPNESKQMGAIEIKNSAYAPNKITVKKGTTVTWTNRDSLQHDVAPDNPTDEFKKSELLSKDESYSVTFNTVGTYTYFCTPHPFMKGTIEVIE